MNMNIVAAYLTKEYFLYLFLNIYTGQKLNENKKKSGNVSLLS